ncbi:hypothetical protein JNUCC1_03340 [Lentibacillus sp. JNUCC-1]|nr:hypothetical protein [Lentibacillus sp. JNUCC-1]
MKVNKTLVGIGILCLILLSPLSDAIAESSVSEGVILETQLNNYKELYENQKEYNEKILTTIYWSLGTMVVFIVLFVGANFIYNRNEFKFATNIIKDELLEETNTKLYEITDKAKGDLDKISNNKVKHLDSYIESEIEKISNLYEDNIGKLNKDIFSLKGEIHDLKATYWRETKVYLNEFSSLIEAIKFKHYAGETFIHTLEDLVKVLKKIEVDDLHAIDKKSLSTILPFLGDEHRFNKYFIESYLRGKD